VGYADRSLLIDAEGLRHLQPRGDVIASNVVIVNGRVAGTWKRSVQQRAVRVAVSAFKGLTGDERTAVAAAARRYGAFMELPVEIDLTEWPPGPRTAGYAGS